MESDGEVENTDSDRKLEEEDKLAKAGSGDRQNARLNGEKRTGTDYYVDAYWRVQCRRA